MPSAWPAILAKRGRLTPADMEALAGIPSAPRSFRARDVIAAERDPADTIIVVVEGWAARCKTPRGGERQIVSLMLPGDFTVVYPGVSHHRTEEIRALTPCEVVEVEIAAVEALAFSCKAVAHALQHNAMVNSAISHEWLANVGRRSAERRLAHLFCELFERLRMIGRADERTFQLPLTQTTLGDALGLSPAHINRTLQGLSAGDLATVENGVVTVADLARLKRFAGFEATYLGAPSLQNA